MEAKLKQSLANSRILVFYSSYGNGHWSASNAITVICKDSFGHKQTSAIDALDLTPAPYAFFSRALYRVSTQYIPFVWRCIYSLTDNKQLTRLFSVFYSVVAKRLIKIVRTINPDIIICTHYLPMAAIAEYKRKHNPKWLLVAVVTDYGAHRRWAHLSVDKYFVATSDVQADLASTGIAEERIIVSGIPVRMPCSPVMSGLPKIETNGNIKIGFLAHGLSPNYAAKVLNHIARCESRFTLMVNYGHSDALRKRLVNIASRIAKPCMFIGFHKDFPNIMRDMRIIITKPGGLVVSEALALEIPLVLIKGYPGQEEKNARFVIKNKVGLMPDIKTLPQTIDELVSQPSRIEEMKIRCRGFARPNACVHIIKLIIEEVHPVPTHRTT